ncbi:tRNA epoxyqueuosine(34) reductase QueG [Siminovitchia sp. FSL H7-0308]|uniref:Epoxyqueuosine reductase n=1 Tax=Siminovitchia thermophila TaxID=1245522 RepID=A0ABS2R7L5_9BACI|nr:tRNA epoxyqueuosine(34) reductase QueG [Siminovitchia thermophila]MBM7715144.1 epoxyqueuosine reductase [Siminovitchia thermophila]ONK22782.1 tRNA epoxyqueuosine(34) reductase QueG [Bacillus sp. VT-16-64]
MDYGQLKEEIIEYSKQIGIDKIGFAASDPFIEMKNLLMRQEALGYQSGFEHKNIDERTHPELIFEEPRSIIAIALAYPSKMTNPPRGKRGERRGIFCRASWGIDYHILVREKLEQLAAYIKEKVSEARCKLMVDTGELVDRAVAERAGIGWSGKNCSIITPEFGSYVYLGEMITNLPFEPDEPLHDQCGECTKCLEACPTGALVGPGQLNAQRCIAFLTQTKGFLPDEFREEIGNRLYGCDTCQTVCPKNKGIDNRFHPKMEPDPETAKPLLKPLLQLSNREFKEKFGKMAGSWRGKKPIQRNAILALAHFKEEQAVDDLIKVLQEDVRPEIRGTAAWSLGKIGGEKARTALLTARVHEKNSDVQQEIQKGLHLLNEQ